MVLPHTQVMFCRGRKGCVALGAYQSEQLRDSKGVEATQRDKERSLFSLFLPSSSFAAGKRAPEEARVIKIKKTASGSTTDTA